MRCVAFINWIELAALLLTTTAGLVLWWVCKRRASREGGFEGIITERGKPPLRGKPEVEEEIERLKAILGRK